MNILFVNNIFPPGFIGGYEIGTYEIAQGLMARGHNVSVLTSDYFQDDHAELREMNIERTLECRYVTHEIPSENAKISGFYIINNNIRKLGSALRRLKPDVVMLFNLMGLGALGILQFLQATGLPVILYLMDNVFVGIDRHSNIYAKFTSIFGGPSVDAGTRVVAMSRNVVGEASETLDIVFNDVLYVPGWVNFSDVEHQPAREDDDTPVRFVFCSRIAPHKGTELLLDAAEFLVRRGATDFSVDIYGAGLVGPFLQAVQARKLSGFVRYCGCKPKEQMLKLFSRYDALLFPTWQREAFGFAVSEAAASGCFPIMTAGIGAGEWFISDVDCMKIERTARSLASAMDRTMAMTVEERNQFRSAAMKTARLCFPLDYWIQVIDRACIEMAGKKLRTSKDLSSGIQSAFLFLSDMWRESLG
jgi:glycosyltransferase involved in cell wall biosynthesis